MHPAKNTKKKGGERSEYSAGGVACPKMFCLFASLKVERKNNNNKKTQFKEVNYRQRISALWGGIRAGIKLQLPVSLFLFKS